jgi:hypothetical protein
MLLSRLGAITDLFAGKSGRGASDGKAEKSS